MNYTAHSETGRIKSIVLKPAQNAFVDDFHIERNWKSLNFLGKPNFNRAVKEYEEFQASLKLPDAEFFLLPQDNSVNMDSVYCRDSSIATNRGMIICNMGKAGRRNEPAAVKKAFEKNGIPVFADILPPGTLEGGDVAWLDENSLAVGHTYRTNEEGVRQLTAILKTLGAEVITVPLPHYKGPSDVFHLMSVLSPVDKNLAVVYSPLLPIKFRNFLLDRGYRLVEVPDTEFVTMGCNVLALAPRECLMTDGNPRTKSELERAGCKVIVYRGEEISIKGGGGPTCLKRPIYRYK
jgi:N-dimethylarginine dimethylaminohydrolase